MGSMEMSVGDEEEAVLLQPLTAEQLAGGLQIAWGVHPTPYGEAFIAGSGQGICALWFCEPKGQRAAQVQLQRHLRGGRLIEDPGFTLPVAERLWASPTACLTPLRLHVHGTAFQHRVWRELLSVRPGQRVCYLDLATRLGQPSACRAVGAAVGQNPVAVLIPCHRVVRKSGLLGGYRWGQARKSALLAAEAQSGGGYSSATARTKRSSSSEVFRMLGEARIDETP
jgi:AraC family transcriptional regulator, regulatory protein of adaptative response / methylated-DNA-[protein]-cysteine methyltransferase